MATRVVHELFDPKNPDAVELFQRISQDVVDDKIQLLRDRRRQAKLNQIDKIRAVLPGVAADIEHCLAKRAQKARKLSRL
jgi:hypothetical protein